MLGTAACQHAPCTSIARTLDRGASWRGLPAPAVPLGEPDTSTARAAWGIRFATPEHGFVFGNGLWVTTDGGEHWSAVAHPGGAVVSLEIIDHQVLAVTARHGPHGLTGWTLSGRALDGGPWIRTTALAGLALLCTGQGYMGHTDKTVYASGNLGATWKLAGHPGPAGDGGMIAVAAPGHLTIATASAASWLYYSSDNGSKWRSVVTCSDGGMGWNDLGFTTTRDGMVIHGHPAVMNRLGQLMLTDNGGLAWHVVKF